MIVTFVFSPLGPLFRFSSIAKVKRKGKTEPVLDCFCLIYPMSSFTQLYPSFSTSFLINLPIVINLDLPTMLLF